MPRNLITLTAQNFEAEVLKASCPVLVHFTAIWCGPCKAMGPVVDKIADDFVGKIKVGKLDIDAEPSLTSRYGVRSVPHSIVFRGGQKTGSQAGVTSREALLKLLGV